MPSTSYNTSVSNLLGCNPALFRPHKSTGTRLRKMQIHKNNLFIPSPHFLYINILIMHILSVLNNVTVHFPYFAVDFFLLIACRFCRNSRRNISATLSFAKKENGNMMVDSNVSFVSMSLSGVNGRLLTNDKKTL